MKPHVPLLAVSVLLLSACGPTIAPAPSPAGRGESALTPAPSPTGRGESALTPTPTRTPTPTLTPTPTITPTPSLPPEIAAHLEGRGWRIEGDKVMVGDVAWYTQDAEGRWQPADFIREFDKFGYPMQGLTFSTTENGIEAVDAEGRLTKEPGRVVYTKADGREGLFYWRFAASYLDRKTLKYHPDLPPKKWNLSPVNIFGYWKENIVDKAFEKLNKHYGIEYSDYLQACVAGALLLGRENGGWSWGYTFTFDGSAGGRRLQGNYDMPTMQFLFYETASGEIEMVPLINDINPDDIFNFDPDKIKMP